MNRSGFTLTFENNSCLIKLKDVLYVTGELNNGIYILNLTTPIFNVDNKRQKIDNIKDSYLWHCRLGHINEKRMNKLYKLGNLESFDLESYDTCESCLMGKMTKTPFSRKGERATGLLDLIHTDVCGPMSIHARGGF